MARDPTDSRSTRRGWLESGLALLRAEGDQRLTIEALCSRMKRTKGSFYHHFASRDDFVIQLLEHWEQNFTRRIIEDLKAVEDPIARLRALGERTAREVDLRLERTIRMWSDREPAAGIVLQRVDRQREDYLCQQFEIAIGDPRRARLAARAHLALLVGTEMLYQDLSRNELRELNAFVDHLGFVPRPSSNDGRTAEERERP